MKAVLYCKHLLSAVAADFFFGYIITEWLTYWEAIAGKHVVRVIPEEIPRVERRIMCAEVLDAVIRFYGVPENQAAFEQWRAKKGVSTNGSEDRK